MISGMDLANQKENVVVDDLHSALYSHSDWYKIPVRPHVSSRGSASGEFHSARNRYTPCSAAGRNRHCCSAIFQASAGTLLDAVLANDSRRSVDG